ncbi:hypothetical protein ACFWM5_20755 [Streptomyces bobili]|uniref:hypothetical protein n=1 Tax=Streptomyces bobili TaxID=67280 RepID=UPI003657BC44
MFYRFERLEPPGRPDAAGGSGIGLTIARGMARAHGGDITAQSAGPGKGATSPCTCRRNPPQEEARLRSPADSIAPPPSERRRP